MEEVFYKKNEHGEFEPISVYDSELLDSLTYGAHLIRVSPGSRSRKYNVDPDRVAIVAALEYAADAIASSIVESSEASPTQTPVTQMQKEAWDNMKEAFDDEMAGIQFPSAHEIIRDVLSTLDFQLEDMLSSPAVRKAYEDFVLLAKLSGEKKTEG